MEKKILDLDYIDIIFDGRNKSYGAYELRKNYPQRVLKSLLVLVCICICSGVAMSMKKATSPTEKYIVKEIKLAEVPRIDPKRPIPPPPPPPPPPVRTTIKFTPPVISKDDDVVDPPHLNKDITVVGPKTITGVDTGIEPIVDPRPGPAVVITPPTPAIFSYVEQMPVPGFVMDEYLSKNIQYPASARDNNIDGKVIVKFVVNEDGSVSDVSLIRGIGGGCDQEAMRVVASMPKWKPGKQNGKPVKVYFTLPISFKLE